MVYVWQLKDRIVILGGTGIHVCQSSTFVLQCGILSLCKELQWYQYIFLSFWFLAFLYVCVYIR